MFFVAVAGAFVVALDLSIVNVAFPSIEASFPEASTTTLSWVLSAYSVVFGALLLGAGRIADRSGRRRWFLRGVAVFTLGSLLCGVATSPWMLIGGRVVQAVGAALLMPASLALLLGATPAVLRAQAVAMWGGISALAVATGPSLGAVLIDAGGWRWAFFINLPVLAVVAAGDEAGGHRVGGRRPAARPRRRGPALAGGGVARPRHHPGRRLGLDERRRARLASPPRWSSASPPCDGPACTRRRPSTSRCSRTAPSPSPTPPPSPTPSASSPCCSPTCCSSRTVWEYSTLKAGLAITPGPLVVAPLSRSTGSPGRPHRLPPGAGGRQPRVRRREAVERAPHAARARLPRAAGSPPASSPASAWPSPSPCSARRRWPASPPDRFGVGGAVNQTARQMGAVLGVALLVSILGTPDVTGGGARRLPAGLAHVRARRRWFGRSSPAASVGSSRRARRPHRWPLEPVPA